MEDIQDGIKVSIQDGVTEDPHLDTRDKSYCALLYIVKELKNPTITSALKTSTDSTDKTVTISTIMETAVV